MQQQENTGLPSLPQELSSAEQPHSSKKAARSSAKQPQQALPVLAPLDRTPAATEAAHTPAKRSRYKWLVGLALVFFLFLLIFIVPADKIPGWNRLAGWMGWPVGAQSHSIAALMWARLTGEDMEALSGRSPGEEQAGWSIFDKQNAARLNTQGVNSGLFSLAQLNAARRARGLAEEGFGSFSTGLESQDPDQEARAAMSSPVTDWSEQAQKEAMAAMGRNEVYFGADADAALRGQGVVTQTQTGSGFIKVPTSQGKIIGAAATDWLGQSIDKAHLVTVENLETAPGEMSSSKILDLGGKLVAGSKPKRDLARVWLLSKASNRAKQLMLRKQLAGAGYMAMEMPQKVYDSFGQGSGVIVDQTEMMVDIQETNKQLKDAEECQKMGEELGKAFQKLKDNVVDDVTYLVRNVPRSCDSMEDISNWNQTFVTVQKACADGNKGYEEFENSCGRAITKGECKNELLQEYGKFMNTSCTTWHELKKALEAAQKANPPNKEEIKKLEDAIANTQAAVQNESDNLKDSDLKYAFGGTDEAGKSAFFPRVGVAEDWAAGLK